MELKINQKLWKTKNQKIIAKKRKKNELKVIQIDRCNSYEIGD